MMGSRYHFRYLLNFVEGQVKVFVTTIDVSNALRIHGQ